MLYIVCLYHSMYVCYMFIKDQSLSQSVNVLRGRGSDFLVTFATMNYGETAPVEFRLVTQQYLIVL